MISSKVISAIDTHTAGEAARLIIGGVTKFPGKTLPEKRQYLIDNKDELRKVLMHEPRGHANMFGAFICEPVSDEADYGIIFMDSGGYLNMCGHNTIAAMTAAVSCGWKDYDPNASEVEVIQETPAGLIDGMVHLKNGEVENVSFKNVPAFLYKQDVEVEVEGFGKLTLDISFGGSFFAMVDIEKTGLKIDPKESGQLIDLGMKIRDAVNNQVEIQHPTLSHIKTVDLVEFYGKPSSDNADVQNTVVFGDGQLDRSPCGTGTCAKLATLYGKGEIKVGESIINESIIKTQFKGKVLEEVQVGEFKAIIPEITGSAYISGINTFLVDPNDPLKSGFFIE